MTTPTCLIEFKNNPENVVYADSVATCVVQLILPEKIIVDGVYILISGVGYAKKKQYSGRRRRQAKFECNQVYLNERMIFINTRGTILTSGTHIYEFPCRFPSNLPTSCEGNIGYKRYTTTFTLKLPIDSYNFVVPFTVIRPIDLNTMPHLRQPIYQQYEDYSLCHMLFCCSYAFVQYSIEIPVGGYVPGQNINIKIKVTKSENQTIREFVAELFKIIDYKMTETGLFVMFPDTIHVNESFLLGTDKVDASEISQEGTVHLNIRVPAVPPTDLHPDVVIKDQYILQVSANGGSHSLDLQKFKIPIIIGSYPLQDAPSPLPSNSMQSNGLALDDSASVSPSAPSFPENLSDAPSDEPPPTYEEANYLNDGSFKPKYPSFKRKTSYSN
ncbi:arrestin domain-containing protein 5-like [Contarinia nasturtii]|uniref:arrestin domain-containing protein 5-like n=1 Tax=Contarinia nasturtii TaxID=265458 RepID=UPI0012D43A5D|nr:arrestin domain-containing protein 5-like [Contarinia nasturtii]